MDIYDIIIVLMEYKPVDSLILNPTVRFLLAESNVGDILAKLKH